MEKHKKIIFLDIDGVLCNREQWKILLHFKNQILQPFDKQCVNLLNSFTDKTGAKIVLSSTWRMHGKELFNAWAKEQGITGEIIDFTPRLKGVTVLRSDEIGKWLKDNPTEKFVIFDDDSFDLLNLKEFLVQTLTLNEITLGTKEGLTQLHIDKALKILGE